MFDENEYEGTSSLSHEQKIAHYQKALVPKSEDHGFLLALPDPRPFKDFLGRTKDYLERYPVALIGEVGLDKQFRIPEAWLDEQLEERDDALTPGGREGRKLSPYRVNMDHQKKVLLAQLRLAGKMRRACSVHGVQAHGVVYETLAETWKGHERHVPSKKERKRAEAIAKANAEPEDAGSADVTDGGPLPYPPRVCLLSFSGPAETVKQYIAPSVPCEVYFSFSTTINSWTEKGDGKVESAVKAVPDNRLLMESDLHTAGDRMDQYLEEIVRKLCKVKGWDLETGIRQLGDNWRRFILGSSSHA